MNYKNKNKPIFTSYDSRLLFILVAILLFIPALPAQVTIGSGITPNRAALLDIKTRQAGAVVDNVSDNENISATGGLLLPRVKLTSITTLEPFVATTDTEWTNATSQKALRMSVVGLMVYNINLVGDGSSIYPAVYTWDGEKWSTSQANPSTTSVGSQPKAFTFYETGTETPVALTFNLTGVVGTVTYQWYQVTGSNVHVRVGTVIGGTGTISGTGATTASFIPTGVIKGTTRNAKNAGFYKFYCVAVDSYGKVLTSDIAEVAVGCGAKNNSGEWITFACFNVGASVFTINGQKTTAMPSYSYSTTSGVHTYVSGEENVWGDLYQWGRIADGHEKRNSDVVAKGALADANITTGKRCSSTDTGRPYMQVASTATTWYGKFITNTTAPYNWHPNATQTTLDQLWRNSRFVQNDPCAHLQIDGTLSNFWHTGTDATTTDSDGACTDVGTAWRIPQQEEWGSLYKGSSLIGSPSVATANSWKWYSKQSGATNLTKTRGYEIQPDNTTTTLFLPAGGRRSYGDGLLYYQGGAGYYWSSTVSGTLSLHLLFNSGSVNPASGNFRAYGFALRCVKNN